MIIQIEAIKASFIKQAVILRIKNLIISKIKKYKRINLALC